MAVKIDRIIEELGRPGAYPHPVDSVQVLQTHISCVFLTGKYAYKVRKPVRFDFLDYSDLAQRRRYGEMEIRLNARLCPEVYLSLQPMVCEEGRLRVGGVGEAVEWAVQMRQLPANRMLPALIESRQIRAGDIERLASVLAAFHRSAESGPSLAANGSLEAVGKRFRDVLPDESTSSPAPPNARQILSTYLQQVLGQESDLFLRRIDAGQIRDCHGDLRAQNVCLDPELGSGIQIFDCVEFNDGFRATDVVCDLAYLAMDLDLLGRADLRRRLVHCYFGQTADADGGRLLRFYRCFRACVRGQIALLASREEEIPPDERQAHARMAGGAYSLACSYAIRREKPALLITMGFSGSGKSALAGELAGRLPAVLLSSDSVRKELAGADPTDRLPKVHYTRERRAAVYRELIQRAREVLQDGDHALLDATFGAREERRQAADLAQECGAELWVLDCRCPDVLILERIRARAAADNSSSDAGIEVYEEQLRSFEPLDPTRFPARVITLDASAPVDELARQSLERFWQRITDQVGSG